MPPSVLSRSLSQAPSQLTGEWEDVDEDRESSSSESESESDTDSSSSSSSSSDDRSRRKGKGKKRKKKWKHKKKQKMKRQKRGKRMSYKDKKVVLRICCRDFEIYAHSKPKSKFWKHVQEQVKIKTEKGHKSLDKAVRRWEKDRRKVLQAKEEGLFSSEEEDDREYLIAIDKWIRLLNGLKEKQKDREDRTGKARVETVKSRRIQENLGRRWAHKERSLAIEADETPSESIVVQDSQDPSTEILVLTS
jgi:hypothetical protein